MFDSIGWGEIIVLGLAALFIFGPDRLPSLAKDAAQGIKKLRGMVTGARGQLQDSLGEDFDQLRDLDLRKYHPKTFIREQLLADDDRADAHPRQRADVGHRAVAGAGAVARPAAPRDRSQPAPYDTDAT